MNHPFLKSPLGANPVIAEADFNVSVSRLFQAWTTHEDLEQWFGGGEGGPEVKTLALRVGGKWEFLFPEKDGQRDKLSGKYLRIEQDALLQFTWTHTRSLADGQEEISGESRVTVTFKPRGEGSTIQIAHESVSAESSRINIGGGWNACLEKMKALIE